MAEIAEPPLFHRQNDAARESAAGVEADGELGFFLHQLAAATPVIRSSSRKSKVVTCGILRWMSG